jgi:hypothetical protein
MLTIYGREDDPLTRMRILYVLQEAKQASLGTIGAAEFDALRRESKPNVMATAIGVARRLDQETSVPWLTDYVVRGPRWILVLAYGAAHQLGIADRVRAELARREAREALDLISQWEKSGETPWDPAKPGIKEPSK